MRLDRSHPIRGIGVLCGGLLICVLAPAQQTSAIDVGEAESAFREAKTLSDADAGHLWGQRLYGPMLFVSSATREVVANEPDPDGSLHAQGAVYTGTLPKEIVVANTAIDWEGKRWTMMLWPLPDRRIPRERLLMHELFHRIQPALGLRLESPENAQLDAMEGRFWLQLEWRALAVALVETGAAQRSAIADALAFRAQRFSLFPQAAKSEPALERNEGLAEYTGIRLASADLPSARWRILERLATPESTTFVRSFAYTSGPAYGVLLDQFSPGWRVGFASDRDLAAMLQRSSAIRPSAQPVVRAGLYGASALRASERERAATAEAAKAKYKALLVDGPTLLLPNAGKFSFGFNPNELVPLGVAGTVYPSMQVSDAWGTLEVEGGALLSSDFNKVTVAAPAHATDSPLKGPGWTLTLGAGWHLKPDEARQGSFIVTK